MADRYWVGTNSTWHLTANWSATSGGAGGVPIPTSADDVYFDSFGNTVIMPTDDIECKNFTMTATAVAFFLLDQNAVIYGDFLQDAGYFGPTGGPDHVIEFKGNWQSNGGTFAVGTGVGIDPTCIFSGTTKTYILNNTSAASHQNFSVTGTYTFSGTRLSVATISQQLSVEGTMTLAQGNRIDLDGNNAGFDTFTGTIDGQGRFFYHYKNTSSVPITGTIKCSYFRLYLEDAVATLTAREWEYPCDLEIEYTANNQIFQLESNDRHFFNLLTIYGNDTGIATAQLDLDTNQAMMWIERAFDIDRYAFPQGTFTLNFGDGTHIFRGTIDFSFSMSSANSHLIVDAGEGTLILWPKGLQFKPVPPPLIRI